MPGRHDNSGSGIGWNGENVTDRLEREGEGVRGCVLVCYVGCLEFAYDLRVGQ